MSEDHITPEQASRGASRGRPGRAWSSDPEVVSPYEQLPWRGQWEGNWWAIDRMDRTHRPYASAQYVIEIIGDYEGLWEPGGGERLMVMLKA